MVVASGKSVHNSFKKAYTDMDGQAGFAQTDIAGSCMQKFWFLFVRHT